jgi:hypothetical protein
MKNRLLPLGNKLLLRKRAIVETSIDQLKNISQIEHTRHRSFFNFLVRPLSELIADCLRPNKPSLDLEASLRLDATYPKSQFISTTVSYHEWSWDRIRTE